MSKMLNQEEVIKIFQEFQKEVALTETPAELLKKINPIESLTLAGCVVLAQHVYKSPAAMAIFGMWLQKRYMERAL